MIATVERLLGALEELLGAEEVALRAGNFQGLAVVQAKSEPLVAGLAQALQARRADERLPEAFDHRLGRLKLRRQANLRRLADLKAHRKAELRRILDARSRGARGGPIYAKARARSTFLAAG